MTTAPDATVHDDAASTRNGVSSASWGSWAGSYSFAGAGAAFAQEGTQDFPAPVYQAPAKLTRSEVVGRLIANDKMAADLETTLVSVRELASQLERTSKDPRIGQIVQKTDSVLASLQTTTRNLAATTPQITRNVTDTTDALPTTLLQAQLAARELELLLGQLRHHWLFGGSSSNATPAPGRRAPAIEVRP